jgi:hypothetical protein
MATTTVSIKVKCAKCGTKETNPEVFGKPYSKPESGDLFMCSHCGSVHEFIVNGDSFSIKMLTKFQHRVFFWIHGRKSDKSLLRQRADSIMEILEHTLEHTTKTMDKRRMEELNTLPLFHKPNYSSTLDIEQAIAEAEEWKKDTIGEWSKGHADYDLKNILAARNFTTPGSFPPEWAVELEIEVDRRGNIAGAILNHIDKLKENGITFDILDIPYRILHVDEQIKNMNTMLPKTEPMRLFAGQMFKYLHDNLNIAWKEVKEKLKTA